MQFGFQSAQVLFADHAAEQAGCLSQVYRIAHRPDAVVALAAAACLMQQADQLSEWASGPFYADQCSKNVECYGLDCHWTSGLSE
jgi:hypothetical protein